MKPLQELLEQSLYGLENLRKREPSDKKKFKVVLGNETCDLDSTVSTLMYAMVLLYKWYLRNFVIPVINIRKADFPIKTEVNYFLKECGVNIELFTFRDQIDLVKMKDEGILELYLVDHHVLKPEDEELRSAVVEIIDHRPKDPASCWPVETEEYIELVGSCSTLVGRRLLDTPFRAMTPDVIKLLYGTIVLDTACFSKTAGIAKPLDFEVAEELKEYYFHGTLNDQEIFKKLCTAKSDISSLTTQQVLMKDLKITSGIPIIGLPVLVQEFLKSADAVTSIEQFCNEQDFKLAVVMGLDLSSSEIQRDICVYCHTSDMENISLELVNSLQENGFELVEVSLPLNHQFRVFKQNNVQFSRKKLLPIVREIIK